MLKPPELSLGDQPSSELLGCGAKTSCRLHAGPATRQHLSPPVTVPLGSRGPGLPLCHHLPSPCGQPACPAALAAGSVPQRQPVRATC